ncbi:MAG: SprB repeat-containing protein, partial [Bacteroidetes bacterium]|nr:SprB repeat-containing protein [Bacteroidota bacterium]
GIFKPKLEFNDGFTPTVALTGTIFPNGKPINSLPTSISGVTTDQRGVTRNTEAACIGAYEIGCGLPQATELSITTANTPCRGEEFTLNVTGLPANQISIYQYQWSFGENESNVERIETTANTIRIKVFAKIPALQISATLTDVCGANITLEGELAISGVETVSFLGIEETALYCKEAAPVPLTGTPEGGTFKINGIISENNEFAPSTITGNEAIIRYEMPDAENGCFNYDEKTVAVSQIDSELNLNIELVEPVKEILCYGEKASIKFKITGGNGNYLYSVNEATPVAAGAAAIELSSLNPGTYSIKAWLANDKCAGTTSYSTTFTEPQLLSVGTSINGKLCNNAFVTATIAGGTKPYNYTWTKPNGGTTSGSTSNNTISIEVTEIGTYTIQVTDAHDCPLRTSSATVSQPAALPVLTFGSLQKKDESCFGANNGTASIPFGNNTGSESVFIEVKNSQNSVVKSQQFTSATGTISISGLAPDTYQVFMRYGAENCTLLGGNVEQTSFTITKMEERIAFKDLTTTELTCLNEPNGSFGIRVTGWANTHKALLNGNQIYPKSTVGQTALFEVKTLRKGDYLLKITDECSNTEEKSISITGIDPYTLEITATRDMLDCDYSENGYIQVKPVGGYPAQGIMYMVGKEDDITAATASTARFEPLPKGHYQIVYKTTQSGCTDKVVLPKEIKAPLPVKFDFDMMDISCLGVADGEISLQAYQDGMPTRIPVSAMEEFEGFTYRWINCEDDSYVFKKQSVPLEHFWHDRYGSIFYKGVVGVEGLPIGKYLCEVSIPAAVTPNKQCFYKTDSIEIKNPTYNSLEVVEFLIDENKANCKIADRRIEVTAKGGWKGYIFSLLTDDEYKGIENDEPSGGLPDFEDDSEIIYHSDNSATYRSYILSPDTYHVFVTDSLGCRAEETYTFTIAPVVTLNAKVDSTRCQGAADGRVELINIKGGTTPYSYSMMWDDDSVALDQPMCDTLKRGFYSFLVTESARGCEGYITAEIKDTKRPYSLMQDKITDVKCNGESNGELQFLLTGGTKPYYSFTINGDEESATPDKDSVFWNISGIAAGEKTLKVLDKAECVQTLSFTMKQPDVLNIGEVKGSEICPGSDKGRIIVNGVTGGTKPYFYSLSETGKYETTPSLKAGIGTHTVYVKDTNNCIATGTGEVLSKSGNETPPKIDFLVSTWNYSSDVLALINISENETANIDSTVFSFAETDTLIYIVKDDSVHVYGKKEFENIDVASKITFIEVKKGITNDFEAKSDSVLFSFTLKMTVYYDDGCDYEIEREVHIAKDEHEIYPKGKITKKQPDILKIFASPNPMYAGGDYGLSLEFANKVNFRVQAYTLMGGQVGVEKSFNASIIGEDGKVTLTKQDLNIDVTESVIFRVYTLTDAASIILLVQ